MKNIIVPVDFSDTSAKAIQFGIHLGYLMGFNVKIIHVADLVLSGKHGLSTPEQKRDEEIIGTRLAGFAAENIEPVRAANRGRAVAPQTDVFVYSGMAVPEILEHSNDPETALIVMGGAGSGAGIHPPGLYGSVATPVASRGGCPLILIPKVYDGPFSIERVAIAFDDTEELARFGRFARCIIKATKPEVRYVHVRKADWIAEIKNEDAFIDLTLGKGAPAYEYQIDMLPKGYVPSQLRQYADDQKIDLLILGGKRQGFWSRIFDKKNLKPILHACGVPMLVIPFSTDF